MAPIASQSSPAQTPDRCRDRRVSKLIARALRHDPEGLGVALDPAGWVSVEALLAGLNDRLNAGLDALGAGPLTRADLLRIVAEDAKRRHTLDHGPQGDRIRAAQGHSIAVDLGLRATPPPPTLYHGTVARALRAIRADGLTPQGRIHVHLSADLETALAVGARRGRPVALRVDAARLVAAGRSFHRAANGVWLTDRVPPEAIRFPDAEACSDATPTPSADKPQERRA